MEQNKENVIDLRVIFKLIYAKRKLYYKVLPATFLLSCFIILCVPRYYTSSVSLAPELNSSSSIGGMIGSMASTFGIDLGSMETSDAISPLLYPDLMDDNAFVVGLFDVRVRSLDGTIDCSYYDYMTKHQKLPWWTHVSNWVKSLFPKDEVVSNKQTTAIDPYHLSRLQSGIASKIRKSIAINVDKKLGVITIDVEAQDPLICRSMADSVKNRLQLFITDYRTNKARIDAEYYEKLALKAKAEYDEVCMEYANFVDSNSDVILQSYRSKRDNLENEMQLRYNTYTTVMSQYQVASAKIQEKTPAFTLLKGASVPNKPAGPKRAIFVLGMTFLAFVILSLYSIKDLIIRE